MKTKHVGAYGKPTRAGAKLTPKNKRAVAAANVDRHRPLKGITLSIAPWSKANGCN